MRLIALLTTMTLRHSFAVRLLASDRAEKRGIPGNGKLLCSLSQHGSRNVRIRRSQRNQRPVHPAPKKAKLFAMGAGRGITAFLRGCGHALLRIAAGNASARRRPVWKR